MSEHKVEKKAKPPRAFGWMAEYEDENKLLDAARKVRDSGYTRTDAFTPFPVHGIDEALGIKPTVLPWFTLFAGMTGTIVAITMQIWMNAVDYPYIISGKPYISLPAFIPVAFELTVLFAAFTTVFAMLGLNGLPKFSNPVFSNPKFDRSTDDRFFLWVDSRDKYFNSDKVKNLLSDTSPLSVEEVREDESPTEIPRSLITVILTLILLTLVPGAIVLNIRTAKSNSPRLHVFFDMDFQPSLKTQTPAVASIFPNGRVQQPPVPGTVARGELEFADPYYLGYDPAATASLGGSSVNLVSFQDGDKTPTRAAVPDDGQPPSPADQPATTDAPAETPAEEKIVQETGPAAPAQESTAAQEPAAPVAEVTAQVEEPASADEAAPVADLPTVPANAEPNYAWLTEFPLPTDEALFDLGRRKFEQNCAVCHGFSGYGDGLVSRRAEALAQGYWLQPTSLHAAAVQQQPVGRLYYTVTNGKGKMGGYGASLNPKERWAVVLYVRGLQRSQNAQDSDVPPGMTVTTQK
ncbi:MAG: quinol:electron acceptor oxidoreductase subunit ActD [Pirellulaceae bacterium]